MIRAAVVILNYNGADYLRQFLPSLLQFSAGHRLIVADNASTDTSHQVVKSFPGIEWVLLDKNFGFAEGYNQAIAQIHEEYLVLLNSDVLVTAGWLDSPLNHLASHPNVGAVQPKIKSFHQPTHFEYAGAAGGWMDSLGYPFCRGRIFDSMEEDLGQFDEPSALFWASGACFFTRRSVFQSLGGFDPLFFAHMEEIDLCWRMQKAGWTIAYDPSATVFHVGAGTLAADSPFKTYLNFRNSLAMLYKNLPVHQIFGKIFLRLTLDGIAGIRFLLQGKGSLTWAIIRAHGGFYALLPQLKRSTGNHTVLQGYWKNSILWSFFVRNKKTFNSLFS